MLDVDCCLVQGPPEVFVQGLASGSPARSRQATHKWAWEQQDAKVAMRISNVFRSPAAHLAFGRRPVYSSHSYAICAQSSLTDSNSQNMATQEELEARIADVQDDITVQGGKVKGLKDKVKEKKKAQVQAAYRSSSFVQNMSSMQMILRSHHCCQSTYYLSHLKLLVS
jgi:hypothetical protein